MSEQAIAHAADTTPKIPWDMAPFDAAEDRIFDAAALARQSFPLAHLVWCKMQASAQQLDDRGRFEVSRGRLAKLGEADLSAIDALISAFAEVGLIAEGRLATFIERKPHKNGHFYRGRTERQSGFEASAGSIETKRTQPKTPSGRAPKRAESSESSSLRTTTDLHNPPPSSSSDDSSACEDATTTTDEVIFQSVWKVNQAKIPEKTAAAAVPLVRKWLDEGLSLELDILPEIAYIVERLEKPIGSLGRPFVINQIRERHDKRLALGASGDTRRDASSQMQRRRGMPDKDPELAWLTETEAAGNA